MTYINRPMRKKEKGIWKKEQGKKTDFPYSIFVETSDCIDFRLFTPKYASYHFVLLLQ